MMKEISAGVFQPRRAQKSKNLPEKKRQIAVLKPERIAFPMGKANKACVAPFQGCRISVLKGAGRRIQNTPQCKNGAAARQRAEKYTDVPKNAYRYAKFDT